MVRSDLDIFLGVLLLDCCRNLSKLVFFLVGVLGCVGARFDDLVSPPVFFVVLGFVVVVVVVVVAIVVVVVVVKNNWCSGEREWRGCSSRELCG